MACVRYAFDVHERPMYTIYGVMHMHYAHTLLELLAFFATPEESVCESEVHPLVSLVLRCLHVHLTLLIWRSSYKLCQCFNGHILTFSVHEFHILSRRLLIPR